MPAAASFRFALVLGTILPSAAFAQFRLDPGCNDRCLAFLRAEVERQRYLAPAYVWNQDIRRRQDNPLGLDTPRQIEEQRQRERMRRRR
jgi:hypothetical protein